MNTTHSLKKFFRTLRILACLGCARTFGEYVHSGWDGEIDYARYRWCGKEWIIPTSAVQNTNNPEWPSATQVLTSNSKGMIHGSF